MTKTLNTGRLMHQDASQVNAVQDGRTEEPVVWSSPEKDTLMATMQI